MTELGIETERDKGEHMARRPEANTLDGQAQGLMRSIRELTETMERRQKRLLETKARDPSQEDMLLDDVDRLSNLVQLAEDALDPTLATETREQIRETLQTLRQQTLALGVGLALGRIRDLRHGAEQRMRDKSHPLGKSFQYRQDFLRYINYLRNLIEALSPEYIEDIATTASAINKLIERDRETPWLRSFADDPPPALIDLQSISFEVAAPGSDLDLALQGKV